MQFALPNGSTISHPDLVAALAKPGDAILESLTPQKADAWHHASCIPGEAGELFEPLVEHLFFSAGAPIDHDNLVEELGDIEFYLHGLRSNVGISYEEVAAQTTPNTNLTRTILTLPAKAADVFDAAKRWVIYNKPLDRAALSEALFAFEYVLDAIRTKYSVTRTETLAGNVWKLGLRYEAITYSDAAAQARADKTVH